MCGQRDLGRTQLRSPLLCRANIAWGHQEQLLAPRSGVVGQSSLSALHAKCAKLGEQPRQGALSAWAFRGMLFQVFYCSPNNVILLILLTKLCAQLWLEINPRNSRYLPNCNIMNSCWDNCKKVAATTGKQLHVSCFALHGRADAQFYTRKVLPIVYLLTLVYLWQNRVLQDILCRGVLEDFSPIKFHFFSWHIFLSPCWVFAVLFAEERDVPPQQRRVVNPQGAIPLGKSSLGNPRGGCQSAHSKCSFLLWTENESLSPPWHRNTIVTFATYSFGPWST